MSQKNTIQCPKCKTEIDVNELLYQQIEQQIKVKFDSEINKRDEEYEKALADIKNQEKALKKQQQ